MARRATLALLMLAPTLAAAQATAGSINVAETADSDQKINIAECNNSTQDYLAFTWTVSNFTVQGTYALLASDTSGCPTTTGHYTVIADNITASSESGSYPPSTQTVSVSQLLNTLQISCTGSASAVYFCVNYNAGGAITAGAASGSLALDLAMPPAPVVTSVTAGDSALNVAWTNGAGDGGTLGVSSSYRIEATSQANSSDKHTKIISGSTSGRVDGLTNGTTYDVVVYAISPGGNQSGVSNTSTGTPVPVEDFWKLYQGAGGRELGGCGTGAAGLAALVALAPLLLRRRGRRS